MINMISIRENYSAENPDEGKEPAVSHEKTPITNSKQLLELLKNGSFGTIETGMGNEYPGGITIAELKTLAEKEGYVCAPVDELLIGEEKPYFQEYGFPSEGK
jgi:hypothetical protein